MMRDEQRSESMPRLLAAAFAWGVVASIVTGAVGFVGHQIGNHLYPQLYEQIPSDFALVPLGLIVGFLVAGIARLASREWGWFGMALFIALIAIAYGGLMFQYSRFHAV